MEIEFSLLDYEHHNSSIGIENAKYLRCSASKCYLEIYHLCDIPKSPWLTVWHHCTVDNDNTLWECVNVNVESPNVKLY